jgi:hypothetical protein
MPDEPRRTSRSRRSKRPKPQPPEGWLARLHFHHRWLAFLGPLLVFMLVGTLEPTPEDPGGEAIGLAIPYAYYPAVYTLKIALTGAALLLGLPVYRQFRTPPGLLAVLVGIVGVVVWVGLAKLHLEHRLLNAIGLGFILDSGVRSGFNPLEEMAAQPALAWGFLAVRFVGLAVVIAVAEELFLRGFLMRFVIAENWWELPFGELDLRAAVVGTVFPMLMHPGELLAAAVWFSMVTWLMVRTRSLWACVVAHGVTNLLLGLYVVYSGDWFLM